MTDMIERRAYLARLFDLYSPLLTEKQQTMFDLYHQCDLSLGEIAEETAISRQAVFDVIKRTENALEEYEQKLHLLKAENARQEAVVRLQRVVERAVLDKAIKREIAELLEKLNQ